MAESCRDRREEMPSVGVILFTVEDSSKGWNSGRFPNSGVLLADFIFGHDHSPALVRIHDIEHGHWICLERKTETESRNPTSPKSTCSWEWRKGTNIRDIIINIMYSVCHRVYPINRKLERVDDIR